MRMLIMGPPGAGKGTQGTKVAEELGIPEISTGAVFRWNIAHQTELGIQVKKIIDNGDLVPDPIVEALVADRLAQPDTAPGFLLDGFPRTIHQAQGLDEILATLGVELDAALSLVVDAETLIARMMKRAAIEGRADDNEETIRHRFEVYEEVTAPLLAFYRERGLLVEVDGLGDVDVVHERIITALKK
ncbi:MAG: adenylate kinase [Propionibacteriaceae bacterium]|jgi:adenylate kinase|nr:adenylate kinase [Propionibacteriaceae bacterium]